MASDAWLLFPIGVVGDETACDYAKDVTACIYNLADGASARGSICDSGVVLTAETARQGNRITDTLTGAANGAKLEQKGTDCQLTVLRG